MAKKHYYHPDLKWAHVGFYKTREGNIERLNAIFIDLIRVKIKENVDKSRQKMLKKLGLSIDLSKSQLQSSQILSPKKKTKKTKK